MRSLFRQILAGFATYGSLVAVVYTVKPAGEGFSNWQMGLLAAATLALITDVGLAIWEYIRRPERRFRPGPRQKTHIRDFMFDWIGSAGQVAVFTRDLTWVDEADQELMQLLQKKARNSELTVVLPEHTALTRYLASIGAKIVTYPTLDYITKSRFTLVDVGRAGARVAVGRSDDGAHIIRIAGSDDPTFYLAEDLVEIIKRV